VFFVPDGPPHRGLDPHLFQRREIYRVTLWGALGNLVLAAVKFVFGTLGNSHAVVADAVHSVSDLATDAAVVIGARFWTAPADEDHPHGHQRIETMITAGIGIALAAVALGIGYDALDMVREETPASPGWAAFWAAVFSIVVKEGLFRWTRRVGRQLKSPALIANAWHHRTDSLSSVPAALAVAVAVFFPAWSFVDHVGALVVSLFILKAGWDIGSPALNQLMDRGAPRDTVRRMRAAALNVAGVRDAHAVRTRYLGASLQVDLHITVDPDATVRDGHAIAKAVRERLQDEPEVVDVIVHLEPDRSGD
jgi:cation diffusion facilitator family transporter